MGCRGKYFLTLPVVLALALSCSKARSGGAAETRGGVAAAKKRPINQDGEIPGYLAETSDGRANIFVPTSIANPDLHPITINYARAADQWVVSNALNPPAEISIRQSNGAPLDLPGETRHRVYAPQDDVLACGGIAMTIELPAATSASNKLFVAPGDLTFGDDGTGWTYATFAMALPQATIGMVCLDSPDTTPPGFTRAAAPADPSGLQLVRTGNSITASWTASSTAGARYAVAYRPNSPPGNCGEWYVEPSTIVGTSTSVTVNDLDPDLTYGVRVCAVGDATPQSKGATGLSIGESARVETELYFAGQNTDDLQMFVMKKPIGANWTRIGQFELEDVAAIVGSMMLDGSDQPATLRRANGGGGVRYRPFANGQWQSPDTIEGGYSGGVGEASAHYGSGDVVHLLFVDDSRLKYRTGASGQWQDPVQLHEETIWDPKFALDLNDRAHVIFIRQMAEGRILTYLNNVSSSNFAHVADFGSSGITEDTCGVNQADIALGSDGSVHLVMSCQEDKIVYAKRSSGSSTFALTQVATFTSSTFSNPQLALTSNGDVLVYVFDFETSGKVYKLAWGGNQFLLHATLGDCTTHGKFSTGIFAIDGRDHSHVICVNGDSTAAFTHYDISDTGVALRNDAVPGFVNDSIYWENVVIGGMRGKGNR